VHARRMLLPCRNEVVFADATLRQVDEGDRTFQDAGGWGYAARHPVLPLHAKLRKPG
jgi:hypothetical protein